MKINTLIMMLFLLIGTFQLQAQAQVSDDPPLSEDRCAGITVIDQECNRDGTVTISFRVYNNSNSTVTLVNVVAGSVVVGTSTAPIPPYTTGAQIYTYTAAANSLQCFNIYLYNERGGCCHREVCVRVQGCCDLQTSANGFDATCDNLGSAGISVWGGTPGYNGGWTNTTTGTTGTFPTIGGPISILVPNLEPGIYTYWFVDRRGCRVRGTFTIRLDADGDNCLDFEMHVDDDDPAGGSGSSGLIQVYSGVSEVATTINFCFWTKYAPDQLIVSVNNTVVLDSGPWSSLGTIGGSNGTCSPTPWGAQGLYFGQVAVNPCDEIEISVDAEVCGSPGGVEWLLDVSCGRLDCDNDNDSRFLTTRGGGSDEVDSAADTRSDDNNLGSAQSLKIFPNPVNDILNITNLNPEINYSNLRVLDGSGRMLIQENMSGMLNLQIDASALQSGVYLVEITDESGNRVIEKFVKL